MGVMETFGCGKVGRLMASTFFCTFAWWEGDIYGGLRRVIKVWNEEVDIRTNGRIVKDHWGLHKD